jgi:hypothetical protein
MSSSPLLTFRTSIKLRGSNLVASWRRDFTFVSQLLQRSNNAILFRGNFHFFAEKTATCGNAGVAITLPYYVRTYGSLKCDWGSRRVF